MKKIYLATIVVALMAITVSCQKETINDVKAPGAVVTNNVTTTNTNGTMGVVLTNANDLSWLMGPDFVANAFYLNGGHATVSNLGDATLYCGGVINNTDMIAAQCINIGTVSYANDELNLYVTLTTTTDWYFEKAQLYVGTLAGVPTKDNGKPAPGQFNYKVNYVNCPQQTHTWTVPLSSIPTGTWMWAVHAPAQKIVDGCVLEEFSSWADGTRFNPAKWPTYVPGALTSCGGTGDLTNNTSNNK